MRKQKDRRPGMERRVVVTGAGAMTPVGHNVGETWTGLLAGRNGIGPITLFDTSGFQAKLAAEVKDFDPLQHMTKIDANRTDRYTQFAIAAAQEAVHDSEIHGRVNPERFGVYLGAGIGGIRTMEKEHDRFLQRGPDRVSPLFVPMMIANMAAGVLAIRYGCRGPVMPAVTACASGSNAIGEALRLIRHGYADAVITGGTEATISPIAVAGFTNMQALSTATDPEEASLPFDLRRKGFVMGEGAVILVLEEYSHAMARNARIYGEICGYGSTCDAYHMTAVNPDGSGGAQAIRQALTEADWDPEERIYINAHGTGTPMNDRTETLAIKKALGEKAARHALISSTKSMTGHMMGAAGAMEALVCLLALRDSQVPPTIHLQEQDPECDLYYVPREAVRATTSIAVSNSFGFGGHNACLAFRKVQP